MRYFWLGWVILWVAIVPVTAQTTGDYLGRGGVLLDAVITADGEQIIMLTQRGFYIYTHDDFSAPQQVIPFPLYPNYDIDMSRVIVLGSSLQLDGEFVTSTRPYARANWRTGALLDFQPSDEGESKVFPLGEFERCAVAAGPSSEIGTVQITLDCDGTGRVLAELGHGRLRQAQRVDDQVFVSGGLSEGGTFAELWDLSTGTRTVEYPTDGWQFVTGHIVAGRVYLELAALTEYDLETGQRLSEFPNVAQLAIAGDVAVYKDTGTNEVIVADASTLAPRFSLGTITCTSNFPVFRISPADNRVYVIDPQEGGTISAWDTNSGTFLGAIEGTMLPLSWQFVDENTIVTVGGNLMPQCTDRSFGTALNVIDIPSGNVVTTPLGGGYMGSVGVIGPDDFLVGGFREVLRVQAGSVTMRRNLTPEDFPLLSTIDHLLLSADRAYVLAVGYGGDITLWDFERLFGGEPTATYESYTAQQEHGVAWVTNDTFIYARDDNDGNTLVSINAATGETHELVSVANGRSVHGLTYASEVNLLAIAVGGFRDQRQTISLYRWEGDALMPVVEEVPVNGSLPYLALSPNGERLLRATYSLGDSPLPFFVIHEAANGTVITDDVLLKGPVHYRPGGGDFAGIWGTTLRLIPAR